MTTKSYGVGERLIAPHTDKTNEYKPSDFWRSSKTASNFNDDERKQIESALVFAVLIFMAILWLSTLFSQPKSAPTISPPVSVYDCPAQIQFETELKFLQQSGGKINFPIRSKKLKKMIENHEIIF